MATLSFVSDEDFDSAIKTLVDRILKADRDAMPNLVRNVRDPIPLLVEACIFGHDIATLNKNDEERSLASGVASAVGGFHQSLLGSMPGWSVIEKGLDVRHDDRRIVAEIKNKHNTMNSSARYRTVEKVEDFVSRQSGGGRWVGYVVTVVPKKPGLPPVEIGRPPTKVYQIEGVQFYALASGVEDALEQVYEQIPERIASYLEELDPSVFSDSPTFPLPTETQRFCDELFRIAHISQR